MVEHPKCPICENQHGGSAISNLDFSTHINSIRCDLCGTYDIENSLIEDGLRSDGRLLTNIQRAALCHLIRSQNDNGNKNFKLTADWLQTSTNHLKLPSPIQQAANAIRFIGDYISDKGHSFYELPGHFLASIGSFDRYKAREILYELQHDKLINSILNHGTGIMHAGGVPELVSEARDVHLTLKGWERYEHEKRGKFAVSDGFIAMKFGDPILDPFVKDVLKPLVKNKLGIDVKDMRDVPKAGLIDNIMRERIRDAAFVLVDLTHDNNGAYWEAGYAEGLGKPVIYLCEQSKFAEKKTHFDTNHCTTVMWSKDGDHQEFRLQIISTIRRSLNLFE